MRWRCRLLDAVSMWRVTISLRLPAKDPRPPPAERTTRPVRWPAPTWNPAMRRRGQRCRSMEPRMLWSSPSRASVPPLAQGRRLITSIDIERRDAGRRRGAQLDSKVRAGLSPARNPSDLRLRHIRAISAEPVAELESLRYRRACRRHVGCGRRWSTAATIDRASPAKPGCC